jgi:hypothetical protein
VKVGHEKGKDTARPVQQPKRPGPAPTAPAPSTTTTTTAPPLVDDRTVIEAANRTLDGARVQFQVLALVRRGGMLILDARLANLDDRRAETAAVRIGGAFDDGRKDRSGATDDSLDGIRVLDPSTDRVYGVQGDSHGECVCTERLETVTVTPGDTAALTATFNVPDTAATTVQILVPGFDRLRDVPVRR